MSEDKMLNRISTLENENAQFKIIVQKFEERISAIESGERGTGVYLDGAPDYVQDYIKKTDKKEEKVGE